MLGWLLGRRGYEVRGWSKHTRRWLKGYRGWLRVYRDQLVFGEGPSYVSLPLDGLRIRRNRWLNGPIVFSHPEHPEWQLRTDQTAILDHPAFRERSSLLAQIRRSWALLLRAKRNFRQGLVAFLLVMVFVPQARHVVVGWGVDRIPLSYERERGAEVLSSLESQSEFVRDPAVLGAVEVIARPLVNAIPPEERIHDLRFHVVMDPSVNAYAVPGGDIVLHSGLILAAESPDEIAGVLAHEIGHVTHRHSMRNIVEAYGALILLELAIGNSDNKMDWPELIAWYLAQQKFSRDHEHDADGAAIRYLDTANVNPRGLMRFFERLNEQRAHHYTGRSFMAHQFLSSHPLPHERLEHLRACCAVHATQEGWTFLDVNLESLKARLRQLTMPEPGVGKRIAIKFHQIEQHLPMEQIEKQAGESRQRALEEAEAQAETEPPAPEPPAGQEDEPPRGRCRPRPRPRPWAAAKTDPSRPERISESLPGLLHGGRH